MTRDFWDKSIGQFYKFLIIIYYEKILFNYTKLANLFTFICWNKNTRIRNYWKCERRWILQKAIKKYNDLLAKRKKLIKTTKTEPVITDPVDNRKKVSKEMPSESPQKIITNEDVQLKTAEERLVKLRTKQNDAGLPLEFTNKSTGQKDATLKEADEELQEVNSKSDDIEAGFADYINCINGNN